MERLGVLTDCPTITYVTGMSIIQSTFLNNISRLQQQFDMSVEQKMADLMKATDSLVMAYKQILEETEGLTFV